MDQAPGGPHGPQGSRDAQSPPTCYRHPDRETGIRCTRCERPICPECMISASVGFQCPECVRDGSGTGHAPTANQPRTLTGAPLAQDPRLVTKILLAINVLVFIAIQTNDRLISDLFLIGAWPAPHFAVEGVADGQWYRLVTSMFAHQEVWHIAFNMFSLWWLGGPLEEAFGRARYLALYLVSGLAGSALTYVLVDPTSASLGASGAIYGLFGATAVLVKRLNYDMRPVIALLAINLIFTFTMSGIAWQAHVGGLIAGVAIAYGMMHTGGKRRALVQWGTCAAVFLVVLVAVVARTASLV
ncbi:rhomboid family intramembrane serine protease [Streptomyces sp. NPDC127068]|uniref:rhomboid family intramembrane serine protease n=1 Tax=Streptomyces sp. NPDC127068 TaxID=3347127 RepID=UPI0036662AC3